MSGAPGDGAHRTLWLVTCTGDKLRHHTLAKPDTRTPAYQTAAHLSFLFIKKS